MNVEEVLSDRKKYADDTKWDLGNGEVTTLGEMRNALMPKGEFTKHTQKLAEKEKALLATNDSLQGQLQAVLSQQGRPTGQIESDELAAYVNDPTFGPLAKRLQAAEAKYDQMEQRSKQHEQIWWAQQHLSTINQLKAEDKELDIQGLIGFAKTRGLSNLADAHALMYRDRDLKKIETDAEKRGYEKAKAEPPPPPIPMTRRMQVAADAPADIRQATDMARSDPEILKLMAG